MFYEKNIFLLLSKYIVLSKAIDKLILNYVKLR